MTFESIDLTVPVEEIYHRVNNEDMREFLVGLIFLALVAGITGGLEMFYYVPTVEKAALSVQTITYFVPLGNLIRNLHYWSAQFLILISGVHLIRVVFTGAYAGHRRFNYLLGLGLSLIIIALDFTGYILRWDVGVEWALVVGTNLIKTIPVIGDYLYLIIVGGDFPSEATLIRFYAWHIFGLVVLALIVIVWHVFRVRHDGGIAVPPPRSRETCGRIIRQVLIQREMLAMVVVAAVLLLVSAFSPAPIASPITESAAMTGDARAPWFLLWVQYLLRWGDPFLWGIVIPATFSIVIGLIPYILPKPSMEELGNWFLKSNRGAQIVLAGVLVIILVLTLLE